MTVKQIAERIERYAHRVARQGCVGISGDYSPGDIVTEYLATHTVVDADAIPGRTVARYRNAAKRGLRSGAAWRKASKRSRWIQ